MSIAGVKEHSCTDFEKYSVVCDRSFCHCQCLKTAQIIVSVYFSAGCIVHVLLPYFRMVNVNCLFSSLALHTPFPEFKLNILTILL